MRCVGNRPPPRPAEAADVVADHPEPLGEAIEFGIPHPAVGIPAVDQHHDGATTAVLVVERATRDRDGGGTGWTGCDEPRWCSSSPGHQRHRAERESSA